MSHNCMAALLEKIKVHKYINQENHYNTLFINGRIFYTHLVNNIYTHTGSNIFLTRAKHKIRAFSVENL